MLEMTTINADQNGNVDSIPGGVSTGYQAQNTLISALFNGLDNINVSVDQTTAETTFHSGGSIEENGILYTLKTDIVLPYIGSYGVRQFLLQDGGTPGTKTIVANTFTQLEPVWFPSKNGWYVNGQRMLNTVTERIDSAQPISIKRLNGESYERFSDTEFVSRQKNLTFDYMELLRYNSTVNAKFNQTLNNLIPNGGISVNNNAFLVQGKSSKIALYNALNPINYFTMPNGGAIDSKGVAVVSSHTGSSGDPIVDTYCIANTAQNTILVMVRVSSSGLTYELSRTIAGPGTSVYGLDVDSESGLNDLYVVDKVGSKIYVLEFTTGFIKKSYSVQTPLYDDIAIYNNYNAIGGKFAFISRVTNANLEYAGLYKTAVDIVMLHDNGSSEKLHTLLYTSDKKRGIAFGDTGSNIGDHQTLFSVDDGNFLFI